MEPSNNKLKKIQNITRHQYGWYVVMQSQGKINRRYFSDSLYDCDQNKSLQAAIQWRELLRKKQIDARKKIRDKEEKFGYFS